MAADELKRSGPSVDLGARIQEALEEAGRACRGELHAEALRRSEEALGLIATLPEGRDRTELEVLALHIKAQAVTFPVGGKEAIAIEEQVLALLERLGDKRRVAARLNDLGVRYSNNRDVKRGTEAHQRALELFAEIGDERGQGAVQNERSGKAGVAACPRWPKRVGIRCRPSSKSVPVFAPKRVPP